VQGGSVGIRRKRWKSQEEKEGWVGCSRDYFLLNVLENVQMSDEHANDLLMTTPKVAIMREPKKPKTFTMKNSF
jgi:hypothetical protein